TGDGGAGADHQQVDDPEVPLEDDVHGLPETIHSNHGATPPPACPRAFPGRSIRSASGARGPRLPKWHAPPSPLPVKVSIHLVMIASIYEVIGGTIGKLILALV